MKMIKARSLPAQEVLWDMFDYDPLTGELSNNSTGHVYGSRKYNTPSASKYLLVSIDKQYYLAHRIIWEMVNGPIPKGLTVDHINLDSRDNRISNLRLATFNQQNRNRRPWTKTGYRGVTFYANRYIAQITINGKNTYLGCFKTPEEASSVYEEAALKYHGQFAGPLTASSCAA